MQKSRVSRFAARMALGTGALVLCALPAILSSGSATASILDGAATITNQALSPLSSGGSTTQFSLALPVNAACSGDTASHGYHVFSYLVQKGTTISSLSFTTHPSSGYGLVNNSGLYYGPVNTANTTGQIIGIPTNFEWAPLLADGATLGSLLYTGGTSGLWEAGLACANSSGTLSDYWNTQVTFTTSASDPNGFTWSAYQVAPITATTTTTASSTFTGQLTAANASGAVTYAVTSPATGISVSSTGAISTTTTLAAGLHTLSGTDTDTGGDAGTWSLTLTVSTVTLAQAAPTSASVPTTASSTFTDQLHVTHSNGALTYAVTTPAAGISVSSSGAISTTGTLAAGTYTVGGTDADADGDSGTWSFTLTVTSATPPPDSFTSATSTSATVGSQLSFSVTTVGTPAPKLKEKGKLPKGVKFNKASHVLGGTPTSTKHKSAAGTYHLTFTATFGKGKTKVVATQAFTLSVSS